MDKISVREKIGYGFGDMASSMFWKLFGTYLLFFYTDVLGISAAALGTMLLVSRIWDTVFDPVVGVIADRTSTRWGKFRPYLLYMALPFGAIGVLTFTVPSYSGGGLLVYAYVTYSLMMMVYSLINVPYASLLGVISADAKDRNALASYRMAFAFAGSLIALALFQPLASFFGNAGSGNSVGRSWQLAVAVISVLCVALFLGCFAWVRERVKPGKDNAGSLKEDIKDLCRNRPWWILLVAGIMVLVFNSIRDGAALYYFKYYVTDGEAFHVFKTAVTYSTLYLVIGQAANIIGVVIATPVANRIGKKRSFLTAMAIAGALSILFYGIPRERTGLIFVFQFFISICAGLVFPLLWSMYADIADYSEWKNGRRATGLVFSSSSMSQKIGWTIGGALSGWLLAVFGFRANMEQGEGAQRGIVLMLSLLPAAGALLSVIILWLYPLSEQRIKDIGNELEKRRKGNKPSENHVERNPAEAGAL
ncbi:MAG TPA: MFS transporter [Puia sp.]|nr:MFS transporter [Puia sp.]